MFFRHLCTLSGNLDLLFSLRNVIFSFAECFLALEQFDFFFRKKNVSKFSYLLWSIFIAGAVSAFFCSSFLSSYGCSFNQQQACTLLSSASLLQGTVARQQGFFFPVSRRFRFLPTRFVACPTEKTLLLCGDGFYLHLAIV